ncbi:MAG: hypothetical protein ACXWUG_17545 [Polyangiales bacterium]
MRALIPLSLLAGMLFCGTARADKWPSLFVEGGAGVHHDVQHESGTAAEGTMRMGVSFGVITPEVFLGVGMQLFTHFGRGSEAALVGRALHFFDDGADWGVIVDAGVTHGFGSFGGLFAISLAAPYGFQLSAVGTLAPDERRSISGLAGFDLVRVFARVLRDSSKPPAR